LDYKKIFKRMFLLLFSPAKAWEGVEQEEQSINWLADYVYPLMGFCGLALFLKVIWLTESETSVFQLAMLACCKLFVALFGSYFLVAFVAKKLLVRFGKAACKTVIHLSAIVGYGMTPIFLGTFVAILLPHEWFFCALGIQCYTLYVLSVGIKRWFDAGVVVEFLITSFLSILMIGSPFLISFVFEKLMNG